jgi:adenosylhomocysteine nucleosidase
MVSILYVMAADPEYGPHLRARIEPLMTGVGPVEAAIAVTRALAEAKIGHGLPDLVVSLGSAGSATLEHTAVYQAASVSYRDMDATALGFGRGVTPFLDLPAVLSLEPHIPGIAQARLSTGANVVSGAGYAAIDADMVDMESFAVLRACQSFGVPLVVLRGISDGVTELTGIADWTRDLAVIDEKLAHAVALVQAQANTIF